MFSSIVRPKGLRFDVVGQVLLAIFRGQLKSGDRLVVKRMADDFGVSATPAREALLELASLGVVDLLPNRGAVVRPFGPRQLKEIYSLRRLLEAEATRLSCGQLPVSALEELRHQTIQLIEDPMLPNWSLLSREVDSGLHTMIANGSNHERLIGEIEHYGKLVWAARSLLENSLKLQQLAHGEHLKIIDSLLAGQPEEAARHMEEHVTSAGAVLIQEIFPDGVDATEIVQQA